MAQAPALAIGTAVAPMLRMQLARAIDELYASAPSEFTKKRDALAKQLGGKDAAKVRARRKPTQIAWVLNQLARKNPEGVAGLADAGRELARAERQALRGGDRSGNFRASIERQRKIVNELTKEAAQVMRDLGLDPRGHIDELASALQAALVDPELGMRLEEGQLEKAPEAAVRFLGADLAVAPAEEPAAARGPTKRRPHAAKPANGRTRADASKAERASATRETKAERDARAKRAAKGERARAAREAKAERDERARAARKARAEELARTRTLAKTKQAIATTQRALRTAEAAAKRHRAALEKAEREVAAARKKLADLDEQIARA